MADTKLGNKKIKDVLVNKELGVFFRIEGPMDNQEGCATSAWFHIDKGSDYESHFLSLLLSYEAQGKAITLNLSGCSEKGYPVISYIY